MYDIDIIYVKSIQFQQNQGIILKKLTFKWVRIIDSI